MTHKPLAISATLGVALILSAGRVCVAAEGASSNYFPGTYGNVAVATPPTTGWSYLNQSLFYTANVDRTLLTSTPPMDPVCGFVG